MQCYSKQSNKLQANLASALGFQLKPGIKHTAILQVADFLC